MPFPLIASRSGLRTVRMRWIAGAVMLLSLLMHLTVLEFIKGDLILPTFEDDTDQVISITLQTPPAVSRAPRATVRKPAAQVANAPVPEASLPAVAEVAPETTAIADSSVPSTDTSTAEVETGEQQSNDLPAAPPEVAATDDAQPPLFDRISLPPAAELGYNFTAVRSGRKIDGYGTISWQPGPTQYVISGEASVLFFTVLSYKSSGSVDALGITPELYVEKRLRKSETNTHFHRERKEISFSASTNSYPIKGGEQDRASVIWQLAALGRGDGEKFIPGLAFELFVAGTRTASDWRIYVNGKEKIDVAGGSTEAWHLTLMSSELGFEKQFELWLAPEMEWYPVRLRYADNGVGYLDMVLSKLEIRK